MADPKVPKHVAIIMDGNGRWAQRRGYPRVFGHVRGSSRIKPIVKEADRLGIRALTLYAFSTENWSRPQGELSTLWKLLKKYLIKEAEELHRENVRLRVLGEVDRLSDDVRDVLVPAVKKLKNNTGLQLCFAVSYGSRRELTRAARMFAEDCVRGVMRPESLNESMFERYLWTADLGNELGDIDLVVRTSGEKRISNFLLWQAAYAEYFFEDTLWPDFGPEHLRLAVQEYAKRDRRYGGLGTKAEAKKETSEQWHPDQLAAKPTN